jgi:hypothetical protein
MHWNFRYVVRGHIDLIDSHLCVSDVVTLIHLYLLVSILVIPQSLSTRTGGCQIEVCSLTQYHLSVYTMFKPLLLKFLFLFGLSGSMQQDIIFLENGCRGLKEIHFLLIQGIEGAGDFNKK